MGDTTLFLRRPQHWSWFIPLSDSTVSVGPYSIIGADVDLSIASDGELRIVYQDQTFLEALIAVLPASSWSSLPAPCVLLWGPALPACGSGMPGRASIWRAWQR